MTHMRAIGLYRYLPIDNPDSLVDIEMPKPKASGRDILVKVKAISVNPVDTKVRAPKERTESEPKILGWDAAGIVEEVGLDCSLFKPGDEVYYAGSIARAGCNSEYHIVDERIVGKKPERLSFAAAAALPLTSITAWEALFERLGLPRQPERNRGKRLLVVGAAGGVGSIATQLAKLAGLTVIGTASREDSKAWVKSHGGDYVINHHEDFLSQLKTIGFDSVDAIFCLNATEVHWRKMVDVIAPQGKICAIAEAHAPLDLDLLQGKSITFAWELMFTRPVFQTPDMIEQHRLLTELAALVDSGQIETTLTETISPINAANLRLAHKKIESGSTIGKIVLEDF